jgi:glutamine---fructose-6-phosphate transaminase (isomerizing)
MTELLKDILKQPSELKKSLEYTIGAGKDALKTAADMVTDAQNIYITGIGSSWHASLAVGTLFEYQGVPVHVVDASELLHEVRLPQQSVLIVLSRSGKSVEVVGLIENVEAAGASVIGITNTPESRLATRAEVVLPMAAAFDQNISITMYSALTLVGGLLAATVTGTFGRRLVTDLGTLLDDTEKSLKKWQEQIQDNRWFAKEMNTYFLGRGGSLASANEARLLWEEAAKSPACAMTTGGFRHGPQEIVNSGLRVMMWLDPDRMHQQDLALAKDLAQRGVEVALIGRDASQQSAALALDTPAAPERWHFLTDIVPAQLAAEHFARLRGVDCDSFRYCPYIIDAEGGLSYPSSRRPRAQ